MFTSFVAVVMDLNFHPQMGLDIFSDALTQSNKLGPLTETACHACMMPIWKKIHALASHVDRGIAERCCQLVLEHTLFQNASADNKARFER